MRKMTAVIMALMMAGMTMTASVSAAEVDAYSSASTTKMAVVDDEAAEVAKILETSGSDLATMAEVAEEGYEKPDSLHALIMSTNPDGCPGMSTIGYWRYINNREDGQDWSRTIGEWSFERRGEGADQVILNLTEGQNALNIANAGVGGRATLVVKFDNASYLIHLNVTDIYERKFNQEDYDAGLFADGYTAAESEASSFFFTCDVLSIEKSYQIIF